MARLFEYQSKQLLRQGGIPICEGRVASNPQQAREIATELGGPVAVKAQAWITGRARQGGIAFADTPAQAARACEQMLGSLLGGFCVEQVLVEAKIKPVKEYFAGIVVDDAHRRPVLIFSPMGGTGIEELAQIHPDQVQKISIDPHAGLYEFQARNLLIQAGVPSAELGGLGELLVKLYQVARKYEARSAEMNPIALGDDGKFYALDARLTIDDNAVFRHPELGIQVAREFDHPPTSLERIAYLVEARDYRGTFYFSQLQLGAPQPGTIRVGFHGAGGGGAMMALDALSRAGLQAADFCDTSGNPPSSKVYRAACIILSQEGIRGYLFAGSGVASQEQYHIARGLLKAFREKGLAVPAVLRFGGNGEDKAVEIVKEHAASLTAPVEAYGRQASVDFCSARLKQLLAEWETQPKTGHAGRAVRAAAPQATYGFATLTGQVGIAHDRCQDCAGKPCLTACPRALLKLEDGRPVLGMEPDQVAKGKCIECLACELECQLRGNGGLTIELPLPEAKA